MEHIRCTSFVLFTTVLALVIQLLIINPALAQDTNTTSDQNRNNTRLIVDLKNHTISVVDTTTNETLSVKKYTPKAPVNTTTDQNIITDAENATTNGNLIPENTTINETLTTNNTGNAMTNENLTAKFNALQGK